LREIRSAAEITTRDKDKCIALAANRQRLRGMLRLDLSLDNRVGWLPRRKAASAGRRSAWQCNASKVRGRVNNMMSGSFRRSSVSRGGHRWCRCNGIETVAGVGRAHAAARDKSDCGLSSGGPETEFPKGEPSSTARGGS